MRLRLSLLALLLTSCHGGGEPPRDPLRYPWEAPRLPDTRRESRRPDTDPLSSHPRVPVAAHGSARARPRGHPAENDCIGEGCHEDMKPSESIHSRVAYGSCERCHVAANRDEHAFLPVGEDGGVCRTCHPPVPSGEITHAPYREAKCLSCHDPHGGKRRALLVHEDPCSPCHQTLLEPREGEVMHGPFAAGDCLACHEAHESEFKSLTRRKSAELCLGCHDREIESGNGQHLVADMAALIRSSSVAHGPIRDGECDGCHAAHHARNANLLRKAYPGTFYQDYDESHYALCFQCHDRGLTRSEHTTTLTGFRDGDRNLHYLHVNDPKGRSCRACHEVHASDLPFHLRQSVPYGPGNWELPINFRSTESGGSCRPGCHEAASYDRGGGAAG